MFAVNGIGDKGSSSARITDATTIRTAEEAFCAKYGRYGTAAELVNPPVAPDGTNGSFLAGLPTLNSITLASGGVCGTGPQSAFSLLPLNTAGASNVNVAFAASLLGFMNNPNQFEAKFNAATSFTAQSTPATGGTSGSLATSIKTGTLSPDVFISAAQSANSSANNTGQSDKVSWFVNFATSPLVVGWDPTGPYNADFTNVKNGTATGACPTTWEAVLQEATNCAASGTFPAGSATRQPKLGRTDPNNDPKGYRTLWAFELDSARLNGNNNQTLVNNVLGNGCTITAANSPIVAANSNNNNCILENNTANGSTAAQVFAESTLVSSLTNGTHTLDAGIFYNVEAQVQNILTPGSLPSILMDHTVNFTDPPSVTNYGSEFNSSAIPFVQNVGGVGGTQTTQTPSQTIYTITIPSTVTNEAGAESFLLYLLNGGPGTSLATTDGLAPVSHLLQGVIVSGVTQPPGPVPAAIQPYTCTGC